MIALLIVAAVVTAIAVAVVLSPEPGFVPKDWKL